MEPEIREYYMDYAQNGGNDETESQDSNLDYAVDDGRVGFMMPEMNHPAEEYWRPETDDDDDVEGDSFDWDQSVRQFFQQPIQVSLVSSSDWYRYPSSGRSDASTDDQDEIELESDLVMDATISSTIDD